MKFDLKYSKNINTTIYTYINHTLSVYTDVNVETES